MGWIMMIFVSLRAVVRNQAERVRPSSQAPYCERLMGSTRHECLEFVIVRNERHLRRILVEYFECYHESRIHLSLDRNSPVQREVGLQDRGRVIAIPQFGGLHYGQRRNASAKAKYAIGLDPRKITEVAMSPVSSK